MINILSYNNNKYTMEIAKSIMVSFVLWTSIVSVPLILTYRDVYKQWINEEWYDSKPEWPSPVGLILGISAVIVGEICTITYFYLWKKRYFLSNVIYIQKNCIVDYNIVEGIITHFVQPEGFVMIGGYLSMTWMFGLLPESYYSFHGGIDWVHVAMQLLIQDVVQYHMHLFEHSSIYIKFYEISHKPHHRFTNPKIFDAFQGSIVDTFFMILVPLFATSRLVNANVWSYMAFGSLYANWLTLIHSEYSHPWDPLFTFIGFGTSGDHHVHHKLFKYNFGHLFMYWDMLYGSYKSPTDVSLFNIKINK